VVKYLHQDRGGLTNRHCQVEKKEKEVELGGVESRVIYLLKRLSVSESIEFKNIRVGKFNRLHSAYLHRSINLGKTMR
jgi:hypothetical protein